MPTYEYRCSDCTNAFEIVQKFSDDALTTCPECEGSLRKVFSAVGVVFKGSGFYATDNRTKGTGSASSTTASTGGESSSDKASESKTETKKVEKKDAPAPAAKAPAALSTT